MTKSELNKKPETELALIAAELGLELDPNAMSKAAMVSKILVQQELLESGAEEVPEDEDAVPEPPKAKSRKYRIIVHNQEGPDNTPFITVGVNGTVWQINRDAEVTVPAEVKEVLENAVITRFEPGADGALVPKDARRFPFSVLGEVA